jgi:hypothetical protein
MLAQIASVQVMWRFQKNGKHGEMVPFSANVANRNFCIVGAFLNLFCNVSALDVDPAFPLVVYRKCPGTVKEHRGSLWAGSQRH